MAESLLIRSRPRQHGCTPAFAHQRSSGPWSATAPPPRSRSLQQSGRNQQPPPLPRQHPDLRNTSQQPPPISSRPSQQPAAPAGRQRLLDSAQTNPGTPAGRPPASAAAFPADPEQRAAPSPDPRQPSSETNTAAFSSTLATLPCSPTARSNTTAAAKATRQHSAASDPM